MEKVKKELDQISGIDRKIADAPKDHIPGWGMDADPENDPTYPMKHWNGADYQRINYEKPPQQRVNMAVFHSIERPGITRVFGTSTPPTGLSGSIRRWAYQHSEATTAHWMGLILADRVNSVEGIIDDIKHGTVPDLFKERGWSAEWKYNRSGFIKNALTGVLVATAVVALFNTKFKK
ncbi:hypothetical protein [Mucilaginibacter lacusdianchii]|uniref:hypothetical protein n=1 Tax=Mucilaginibacter lacusdianchii TaxID=2684211 RepID=UPI00131BFF97|nr:hypothetical protein [Mucilaginibacter sp. JXJ CY 39]